MGKATFSGGVHPYDGKDLSKDKPIVRLHPTSDMVFPVAQHIGAPANPVVAVGDTVLVGQKIAEAGGFVSANIVSSVSGTVKAIEPRQTVSGAMVNSIVIANDGEYKTVEGFGEKRDYTTLSADEIREIVKEAGIVGMGGAGFPTHVKLAPKNEIDYVLVNAAECEPYLTSDYREMLEEPEKLVGGLKIVLQLFPNAKGLICVEDNKPAAVAVLGELVKNEERIDIKVLKTKYPQGAERNIVWAATGRKTNFATLPMDVGCIVQNVDSVCAVYRAVAENIPLIRRIVTVTGEAVKEPQNFNVPIGTSYAELAEAAGGFTEEPKKVISGGPMMGLALYSLDVPVQKTSSALLAFVQDDVEEFDPMPCIRCGRCVAACPTHLVPQKMAVASEMLDNETFEALGGLECYECGSCTFVCPSGRRLTQAFKQSRRTILDARKKK
ncbi:MAG: electron transport complex subunit RsxC [Lachnospiraceae bacterium]|nr:electron transport complex subunit RsxC [Lachnospiraceae bacterium]